MQVQSFLLLIDTEQGLRAVNLWPGLHPFNDTKEALQNVFEDVPDLLRKLLVHKCTPPEIATKVRHALGLLNGRCKLSFMILDQKVLEMQYDAKIYYRHISSHSAMTTYISFFRFPSLSVPAASISLSIEKLIDKAITR